MLLHKWCSLCELVNFTGKTFKAFKRQVRWPSCDIYECVGYHCTVWSVTSEWSRVSMTWTTASTWAVFRVSTSSAVTTARNSSSNHHWTAERSDDIRRNGRSVSVACMPRWRSRCCGSSSRRKQRHGVEQNDTINVEVGRWRHSTTSRWLVHTRGREGGRSLTAGRTRRRPVDDLLIARSDFWTHWWVHRNVGRQLDKQYSVRFFAVFLPCSYTFESAVRRYGFRFQPPLRFPASSNWCDGV